jgi:hypothetical protein
MPKRRAISTWSRGCGCTCMRSSTLAAYRRWGSLTSLQQRSVKTGGWLVKHARYHWLMLAESHLTRRLFGSMVRRIVPLAVATG